MINFVINKLIFRIFKKNTQEVFNIYSDDFFNYTLDYYKNKFKIKK